MNTDTFLEVADLIEYTDRFNLSNFSSYVDHDAENWRRPDPDGDQVWEDCGTTACIAGWVNAWADHPIADTSKARDELGISAPQSGRLFYWGPTSVWALLADEYGWKRTDDHWKDVADPSQITAAQAADVLRRIAKGEVTL